MPEFVVGQRFLSDAEPELGLGIVTEIEFRTLTLVFPATQSTRRYAHANAPLTRITFDVGDTLRDGAGEEAVVTAIQENKGLLFYRVKARAPAAEERQLSEIELSPQLSLSQPLKRLLAGRTESSGWFQLRRAALAAQGFIESSALLGLCSGRAELLPHQLYIAHEVSKRPAPRVLLCDEVGLGKTIEACLILQQQLFSGLASRVLVLVPDSLVHQWLVELLRRFNLRFTILDEERCQALTEVHPVNPFESEQLVLCSREFLCKPGQWREQALHAGWDLLIVDEAHHLLGEHNATTSEHSLYALVKAFAAQVPGLLLLTATPDQSGLASHFALLSLLDPQRFHDLDAFIAEQLRYRDLATQLETLPAGDDEQLDALLDRHGTGRVVFRNTRKTVSGFPERTLHRYPLPLPELYAGLATALQPEQPFIHDDNWLRLDPRVACVFDLTQQLAGQKLLVICHRRSTAQALEAFLRLQRGLRTAVFHEGMTLVERDRAAAYFAEGESGAQVLVCSEIGSEGRNFQFCQHLLLFDLPRNPDLLEQRIGRLDRIGQQGKVNIHAPFFVASAQAILLQLHADSLGITHQPNPVAAQVCNTLADQLDAVLQQPQDATGAAALFQAARELNARLLLQHAEGRDKLLELNSCRPGASAALLKQIHTLEHEGTPRQFLRSVFASYGLDNEENSNGTWTVTPGADMLVESFPSIPDDGITFTLNRSLALKRDDLPFVNWLHPLLLQSLDMVLQDNNGKASVATLRDKRLPTGTLVLESLFRVTVAGPARLQVKRWFPTSTLRAVVDSQKRSIGKALPAEGLDKQAETLNKGQQRLLLQESRDIIELLARLGKKVAEKQMPELIAERTAAMQQALDVEITRLQALQAVNPQVQDSEIDYLLLQRTELTRCFADAQLHTEALRLFVVV